MQRHLALRIVLPRQQVGMCVFGVVRRDATEYQVSLIPRNPQVVVGSLSNHHMFPAFLTERVGYLSRFHRDTGFVHGTRRTGRHDVGILADRHNLRRRRTSCQNRGRSENSDFLAHVHTPVRRPDRGAPSFPGSLHELEGRAA
jgi:hypothetical protein